MNQIFQHQLRRFVLVFFDDLLVYSITMTEYLQHMRKVFSILSTNSLHINAKKCRFRESKLEYLGHWVSVGVEVDKEKISAMTNWPIPRNLNSVNAFFWSREAQATFSTLKQAMTMAPVLALPNFSQEFIVETNASGSSVGAILMQQGCPIAYFSQALPRRAKLKLAYERELMAIVLIVRKWRHYLICQHFIIKID
ncbi:unnamed protein product [Spirodela intermedia]|uniref:Reverse transcriptase domain-containing protein n=1 Tax=Spirodela intermedia TaxID=51605 RepID=A0A7I8JZ11_SPIIN|nr:unnamed protein product [Spirodela intermedia]